MLLEHSKEGLPIIYNEATGNIEYKDTKVSFLLIKEAFESGMDRVQLTEKLELTIIEEFCTFGCLTLTKTKVNQLIKLLWKQLKQYKQVGN